MYTDIIQFVLVGEGSNFGLARDFKVCNHSTIALNPWKTHSYVSLLVYSSSSSEGDLIRWRLSSNSLSINVSQQSLFRSCWDQFCIVRRPWRVWRWVQEAPLWETHAVRLAPPDSNSG